MVRIVITAAAAAAAAAVVVAAVVVVVVVVVFVVVPIDRLYLFRYFSWYRLMSCCRQRPEEIAVVSVGI